MYVDFIAAQIKTLSFLAYIIKIYQVKQSTSHMWWLVHVVATYGLVFGPHPHPPPPKKKKKKLE